MFVRDRRPFRLSLTLLAVLAVVASLVPPLVQAAEKPFHATFEERSAVTSCPSGSPATLVCFAGSGSGHATHLGRATEAFTAAVDTSRADPKTGCAPTTAKASLTAANGDQLFLVTSEVACLAGRNPTASGTYTITGGTGRFEGAGGSGKVNTRGTTNQDGSVSSSTEYSGTLTSR